MFLTFILDFLKSGTYKEVPYHRWENSIGKCTLSLVLKCLPGTWGAWRGAGSGAWASEPNRKRYKHPNENYIRIVFSHFYSVSVHGSALQGNPFWWNDLKRYQRLGIFRLFCFLAFFMSLLIIFSGSPISECWNVTFDSAWYPLCQTSFSSPFHSKWRSNNRAVNIALHATPRFAGTKVQMGIFEN